MTLLFSSLNEQPFSGVDISERGLAYGDGHFTTAKIIDGDIAHLERHIARLMKAQQCLRLKAIDWLSLSEHIKKVAQPYTLAVLKIIITAGQGGRGYSRNGIDNPNVYVTVSQFPQHYLSWQAQGINVGLAQFTVSSHSLLSGLKHLNRLEQVMIRAELDERSEQDILVCNQNGYVIEASCANVFWLKNGHWHTPSLASSGVDGIVRQKIIDHLDNIVIDDYHTLALADIEAMFLTNSIMGIVPVSMYNQGALSISPVKELQRMTSI